MGKEGWGACSLSTASRLCWPGADRRMTRAQEHRRCHRLPRRCAQPRAHKLPPQATNIPTPPRDLHAPQGVGAGTANNPFWELYNPDDNSVTPFAMRTGYLDGAKQVGVGRFGRRVPGRWLAALVPDGCSVGCMLFCGTWQRGGALTSSRTACSLTSVDYAPRCAVP